MLRRFHQKKIRSFGLGCLAFGIVGIAPRTARAEVELFGATLAVRAGAGAESCPDANVLRERTAKLGTPRTRPQLPLAVEVEFVRAELGYRAIVRTSGRTEGTRELSAEGSDCEPAAAATAVVLAVVLDLLPPKAATVTPPPVPLAPPPSPAPRAPGPFRYAALGASVMGAYGLLGPVASVSFAGEARLRLTHFELELGGFGGPAMAQNYPPGSVDVSLAAGNLGFCGYFGAGADELELGACATLLLGALSAAGHGFHEDREASSFFSAGALGATLAIPLARHWAVRFGLDVVVPFRQYRLEVERVGVVFDSTALALALALGPEFRFR